MDPLTKGVCVFDEILGYLKARISKTKLATTYLAKKTKLKTPFVEEPRPAFFWVFVDYLNERIYFSTFFFSF